MKNLTKVSARLEIDPLDVSGMTQVPVIFQYSNGSAIE